MILTAHKARAGTQKITITLSKAVRDALQQKYRLSVLPGYAVQVKGHKSKSPRNLIVVKMKHDDPLLNRQAVARIDMASRNRLGIVPGDSIHVSPLKYETWFHGTRIPDPLTIKNQGWIVGPGAAMGPGIYLTTSKTIAMGYARTALIECQIAWGQYISWPTLKAEVRRDFDIWCHEHQLDPEEMLRIRSPFQDSNILKWTRLFGHYFSHAGSFLVGKIRVFPGPIGSGFKPNRLRIMKILRNDGQTVIWERGRRP